MKDLARRFLRTLGLIHVSEFSEAREKLEELHDYATRSGHLRNGTKAGKRVERELEATLEAFPA